MLNSKDKIVQNLKEHFNRIGVNIELTGSKMIVTDNLLNATIILHVIIAVLGIEFLSNLRQSVYLAPVLFLYAIIGYVIFWLDYKAINVIEFDLINKNFSVTSRSVVRRLADKYFISRPAKYYFEEIAGIEETEKQALSFPPLKHFVNLRLKNGNGIELISFSDKLNAILFSKFMSLMLD